MPAKTRHTMADAKLWKSIEAFVREGEAFIQKKHKGDVDSATEEISSFHTRRLYVNGIWWRLMNQPGQNYMLPGEVKLEITRFMRKHNLVEKPRRHRSVELDKLYKQLRLTESESPRANESFLRICQSKVASFIRDKGRLFKKQGICNGQGSKIKWRSFTNAWLHSEWNGEIVVPSRDVSPEPVSDQGVQCITDPGLWLCLDSGDTKTHNSKPHTTTEGHTTLTCPIQVPLHEKIVPDWNLYPWNEPDTDRTVGTLEVFLLKAVLTHIALSSQNR